MLLTIFVVLIICEVFLALQFSKMACLVVGRSHTEGLELFGRRYRTVYELYMDFNFLNDLFDGKAIGSTKDDQLRINLLAMRKVFIAQIIGGLLFFFVGIALGLTSD